MKIFFPFLSIVVALLIGACTPYSHEFSYKQQERGYSLHLPKNYDPAKKYPLVLNFHAFLMTAENQQLYCEMDRIADTAGFIVVYPQGLRRQWDVGLPNSAYMDSPHDIGFIASLLDTLENTYSIDKSRIYAVGMSMGGFFSYRLACELRDRFAAIASVSGLLSKRTASCCKAAPPIPILHMHGTWDPIVRYNGLKTSLSVAETLAFWVTNNNCSQIADTVDLPNDYFFDFSSVQLIRYKSCDNETEVWFYKVNRGGHSWPGWRKEPLIFGLTNRDISGSVLIWNFFRQHSLANRTISSQE